MENLKQASSLCWSNFVSDDGTGNCRLVIMEFETEYWQRSPLIQVRPQIFLVQSYVL